MRAVEYKIYFNRFINDNPDRIKVDPVKKTALDKIFDFISIYEENTIDKNWEISNLYYNESDAGISIEVRMPELILYGEGLRKFSEILSYVSEDSHASWVNDEQIQIELTVKNVFVSNP